MVALVRGDKGVLTNDNYKRAVSIIFGYATVYHFVLSTLSARVIINSITYLHIIY